MCRHTFPQTHNTLAYLGHVQYFSLLYCLNCLQNQNQPGYSLKTHQSNFSLVFQLHIKKTHHFLGTTPLSPEGFSFTRKQRTSPSLVSKTGGVLIPVASSRVVGDQQLNATLPRFPSKLNSFIMLCSNWLSVIPSWNGTIRDICWLSMTKSHFPSTPQTHSPAMTMQWLSIS